MMDAYMVMQVPVKPDDEKEQVMEPGSIKEKYEEAKNLYIAEGSGILKTDEQEEPLNKGWVYRFSPGENAEFVVKEKVKAYFIPDSAQVQ